MSANRQLKGISIKTLADLIDIEYTEIARPGVTANLSLQLASFIESLRRLKLSIICCRLKSANCFFNHFTQYLFALFF